MFERVARRKAVLSKKNVTVQLRFAKLEMFDHNAQHRAVNHELLCTTKYSSQM